MAKITKMVANKRPFTNTCESLFPLACLSTRCLTAKNRGNALKVAQQFGVPVRTLFESIIIQGHSLAESFDEWVKNGEQMGRLVAERASLSGDEDDTRVSTCETAGLAS